MSMTMWIGFSPPPTVTLAQPARSRTAPIKRLLRKSMSFPLKKFFKSQCSLNRLVDVGNAKLQVVRKRFGGPSATDQMDVRSNVIVTVSQVGAKCLEL